MKSLFTLKGILNILKYFVIFIVFIVVVSLVVINVTPRPIVYLAKRYVFDPTPQNKAPDNYEELLKDVDVIIDREYESKYNNNTYDVYSPKNSDGNNPVVIWIHGGGFIGGDKAMVNHYATSIASEGYTVIAMNYALSPDSQYPTPVYEVNELIEHIIKNQEALNIDENNIVFAGDSAGAQIASQYVMTQTDVNYAKTMSMDALLSSDDIKGMLLYCGPYRIEDLTGSDVWIINYLFKQLGWAYFGDKNWIDLDVINEASITDNVSSNFPPAYITDGNTASFETSGKGLSEQLNQLGVENTTRFFNKEDKALMHEFQFDLQSEEGLLVLQDTLDFLADKFSK